MKFSKEKALKELRNAGILVFCHMMMAFLVSAFIIPHDIIMGGATGAGILLGKLLSVDTSAAVMMVNLVMLLLGGAVFGKRFLVTTVSGSVIYPVFLYIFQRYSAIAGLTDDTLAAVLVGGGLLGVSVGLLMRIGSSSGGTDILSLVLNRWFHMSVASAMYAVDFVIMAGQVLLGNVEGLLYGVILLVVMTCALNQVLVSGQTQMQVTAVSDRYEEIRRRLIEEIGVGVTMVSIETGYLCRKQMGVLCVISKRKLHDVLEAVQKVDSSAFVTITQIKEARGQGFTRVRVPLVRKDGVGFPEGTEYSAETL